uniref:Putative orf75 protein n=1 Tax=Chondrus crispus TaxID=2769 RepID=Q36336_CHOCR|nr:putative orf75 [Chondrus crispus]
MKTFYCVQFNQSCWLFFTSNIVRQFRRYIKFHFLCYYIRNYYARNIFFYFNSTILQLFLPLPDSLSSRFNFFIKI